VALRRPHFLNHLAAALEAAGDREVMAMTVRLIGVDVPDELSAASAPTTEERRLLASASAVAERHGRPLPLLIVPATNIFDALVETIVALRASEIYVGESETLSADDQARLLGEAWERVPKPEPATLAARLVIRHTSGRTALYHLGVHPPTLGHEDLELIHSLWLDVTRTVGPHIHHHDIVRAALKHMEQQLQSDGPPRDTALERIRQTARPSDELAAVVRQRDYARLRDMVRNRPASDVAAMLTELPVEEQVVVFRVLPRKDAAATFEYLTREAQETLIKAMAQEDVASLLNNMAPDERTMFLEELPASVTQQLLALLTPEQRAVALTLLGYPEGTVGRLMTPDYVAVRQHWTVQEVLDHIREHGRQSETLNVVYVVDDHGVLIDDIRIREFLLASLQSTVADLMDRRVVALKAADSQESAVTVFRSEDRSALPVTDSAGVLIGIVTIDDVLDVAEALATREVQRIGGSEALDQPYLRVGFAQMIQKRAGWLTVLFLGEMLTATAMGAFEQEIERAVVLALFVPLIISSGGNSGSQASTLVIRALAIGELTLKDWWLVMRREIAAGLALGGILGLIGFLRIALWSAFSTTYGEHWMLVGITVATTLAGVVLWGTLVGSLLPFLMRRLGFDPAVSSAPFVATLVDVTGLIIYFSIGVVILRGTLL
jgi:magnesium transporter